METREGLIRERAYELWERSGRSGSPEEHWLRAERELAEEAERVREHVHKVLTQVRSEKQPQTMKPQTQFKRGDNAA